LRELLLQEDAWESVTFNEEDVLPIYFMRLAQAGGR
jgi:UDP-3-O-[3-hydroxymyristoyl] N-acetylglucosamine deacetylase